MPVRVVGRLEGLVGLGERTGLVGFNKRRIAGTPHRHILNHACVGAYKVIGHYLDGARYPVGGASAIAEGLVPVIESAGGRAQASTPVSDILMEEGKADDDLLKHIDNILNQ